MQILVLPPMALWTQDGHFIFLSIFMPSLGDNNAHFIRQMQIVNCKSADIGRCLTDVRRRLKQHSPLLCFSRFDSDALQNKARGKGLSSPWDDVLDRVPDIGPHHTVFPLELDHDQLTNIQIQCDKKGIGFITSNSFVPWRYKGNQTQSVDF